MLDHIKLKIPAFASPSRAMHVNPTDLLLAEVRRYAIAQGVPSHTKLRVCVKIADTGEEVARLLAYPAASPIDVPLTGGDPGDFDPTPLQIRMIQFLAGGTKSPTQMKAHTNGRMYDSPHGITELIELGIVEKKFSKLRLTEIGQSIAEEIGTEEPET